MNDWNWASALSDIYHSINLKDLWTQRLSFSSPFEGTNLYRVYGASLSHLMLLTQLVHFMLRLQINRPLQLKGCNSTRLSRLRCTWSSLHLYLIQLIFAISHPVLFFIETFNCCWDLTECRLSLELAYHISPCLLKLFWTYSQHVCQSAFMSPGYLSSGYLSSWWRFFFLIIIFQTPPLECLLYIDKIRTRRLDPRYSWKYWYFQEYEHKKGTFCAIVRHGDKSGWRCLEGELAISLKTGQTPSSLYLIRPPLFFEKNLLICMAWLKQ